MELQCGVKCSGYMGPGKYIMDLVHKMRHCVSLIIGIVIYSFPSELVLFSYAPCTFAKTILLFKP